MAISFDLARRHWTAVRGPLTFIGSWIHLDGRWRPAMFIIPTNGERDEHTHPCVVTMDSAWIWSEEVGDPREAARQTFAFCQQLRINTNNRSDVWRLTGHIIDLLQDLLTIPPYVADDVQGEVIGEITMTNRATGKVTEAEMRDDV